MFQPVEIDLVARLLDLILLFSITTTDLLPVKLYQTIAGVKQRNSTTTDEQVLFVENSSDDEEEDGEVFLSDEDDVSDVKSGPRDVHFVGGEQRLARRINRIRLFEAGTIDSVGRLLICTDNCLKVMVHTRSEQ